MEVERISNGPISMLCWCVFLLFQIRCVFFLFDFELFWGGVGYSEFRIITFGISQKSPSWNFVKMKKNPRQRLLLDTSIFLIRTCQGTELRGRARLRWHPTFVDNLPTRGMSRSPLRSPWRVQQGIPLQTSINLLDLYHSQSPPSLTLNVHTKCQH